MYIDLTCIGSINQVIDLHLLYTRFAPVAERLRRAYSALPERAGVGSIPANEKKCLLSAVGDLKCSLVPLICICYIPGLVGGYTGTTKANFNTMRCKGRDSA
jgi:hypothetical protein